MNNMASNFPRFSSWREKPRFGEPAHGYMATLVGEEGHNSARVYAAEIEINGRNIVLEEILDELLKLPLSDEHRASIVRWTPVWNGNFHMLGEHSLRRRQVSFYDRRFCRACLAESAHHRSWWDIVSFQVCPLHATYIESRTRSGERIRWWWPSFESAPDGEYLPKPMDRKDDQGFEHYLLCRLGVLSGTPRPLLDSAPLHEVIDVCEGFGRFVQNPCSNTTPRASPSDARAGFEFLNGTGEDLEEAIREWLEENVPEALRKAGLKNGIGWFANVSLHNFSRASIWSEIRGALLRAFARAGRIGRQHMEDEALPHHELTIKEVAKVIGADVRGLRAISRHIGLTHASPAAADRAYLTRDKVDILHAAVKELLPITEVAALLGCSQVCARGLVEAGAMRGLNGTRMFGTEGHGLAVLRPEVEALLARIQSVPVGDVRGLAHKLPYLARMTNKTAAALVLEVLDGRVAVTRADRRSPGISAWRFDAATSNNPYRRQSQETDLRAVEATVISGFQMAALAAIAEAGIVKSETRGGRVFFNRKSFNEFHARFANAKLFQAQLGCGDHRLEHRLRELKIKRHYPEVRERNNIYIVERTELERVLGSTAVEALDPAIWTSLRDEMTRVCPSWILPPTTGGAVVKAYLATRTTFVEMEVVKDTVVIRKKFRKAAPREWKVFVEKQQRIRSEWTAFKWSHASACDGVTAEFTVGSVDDVEVASAALRGFYGHYRNPKKMPTG
jgi:hypothetical protein